MVRFNRGEFIGLSRSSRSARCQELADVLSERISGTLDFHRSVKALVSDLRALGHDLWSVDESDDMEIWGPDYETPSGPGIVVTFRPDSVTVEWAEG